MIDEVVMEISTVGEVYQNGTLSEIKGAETDHGYQIVFFNFTCLIYF